jgi:hypothetical protein
MKQITNVLKTEYDIKTPQKRFESLKTANYYLFGEGFDQEFEEFRIHLSEKLDKATIFQLLLREGMKVPMLKSNFEVIKRKWEEKEKIIDEDSFVVIRKLHPDEVSLAIDNHHAIGFAQALEAPKRLEEEKKDIVDIPLKLEELKDENFPARESLSNLTTQLSPKKLNQELPGDLNDQNAIAKPKIENEDLLNPQAARTIFADQINFFRQQGSLLQADATKEVYHKIESIFQNALSQIKDELGKLKDTS